MFSKTSTVNVMILRQHRKTTREEIHPLITKKRPQLLHQQYLQETTKQRSHTSAACRPPIWQTRRSTLRHCSLSGSLFSTGKLQLRYNTIISIFTAKTNNFKHNISLRHRLDTATKQCNAHLSWKKVENVMFRQQRQKRYNSNIFCFD